MALTAEQLAQLRADIAALQKAVRSGVKSATIGDETTTFHSMAELRSTLADLEAKLAAEEGAPRVRAYVPIASKGL